MIIFLRAFTVSSFIIKLRRSQVRYGFPDFTRTNGIDCVDHCLGIDRNGDNRAGTNGNDGFDFYLGIGRNGDHRAGEHIAINNCLASNHCACDDFETGKHNTGCKRYFAVRYSTELYSIHIKMYMYN